MREGAPVPQSPMEDTGRGAEHRVWGSLWEDYISIILEEWLSRTITIMFQ